MNMTIALLISLIDAIIFMANLGILAMMIKLFTEWMKESKYRERK